MTSPTPPRVLGRRPEPKPCPTCYAPMRPTSGVFACERHGVPGASPAPPPPTSGAARPTSTRARTGRGRFPSDDKTYPLPPSPDGRAHGRTGPGSPTTARSLLTPPLVARAVAEAGAGATPHRIAAGMWEEAGYGSLSACKGALYRALRAAGAYDGRRRPSTPGASQGGEAGVNGLHLAEGDSRPAPSGVEHVADPAPALPARVSPGGAA